MSIAGKIKLYTVVWSVDVDAASPEEAAKQARTLMQPPTWATVFQVTDVDQDKMEVIDLGFIEEVNNG